MEKVKIISRQGVSIWGKVLSNGKLGQFEIRSHFKQVNGIIYALLSEAQAKMEDLLKPKTPQ